MKKTWILNLFLLAGFSFTPLVYGVSEALFLQEDICAQDKICIRGSLYFNQKTLHMSFSGKVLKSTEPGKLTIKLIGESKSGKSHKMQLTQSLQGKYSEIVEINQGYNFKTTMPQKFKWQIEKVTYRFKQP